MQNVAPRGSAPERVEVKKAYLPPLDHQLITQIQKLLSSAYILGMDHASGDITAADDDLPPLPFRDAVSAIKSRISLTKAEWKALEAKMRFRAFTVARMSTVGAIDRVRSSVIAALEKGTPFSEFWTEASSIMSAGISTESPWYWETVFRTNVQTAYNTGRAAEFARVQPEYLEFVGIEDERQTSICAERSGVIRPASDPWWQSNWPPLHFNCRSTPRAVFQAEVDLLREENPDWKITPDDSLQSIPKPSGDFGANPLSTETFWKLTPQMVTRAEYLGIIGELRDFSKSLGLQYDPAAISSLSNAGRIVEGGSIVRPSAAARRAALESMKAFGEVPAGELNESVTIGRQGRRHAKAFSADPIKLTALQDLPELIDKATYTVHEPYLEGTDFSEVIKGRVAYKVGQKTVQFEVVLFRRASDGKLFFRDLIPYEVR